MSNRFMITALLVVVAFTLVVLPWLLVTLGAGTDS